MALTYQSTLDRMKRAFPKWADVRKRTNTSNGGKLLKSFAFEAEDIQREIEEYQKIFFIVNYYNKETDFIDYLYVANVGDNGTDFELVDPAIELTTNQDYFYNNFREVALYQNGQILFHEDILNGNLSEITYKTERHTYKSKLSKRHIWNAFDEFALFAGIERLPNETNKQLETRTLNVFKNFPNPSTEGLKSSIINILSPHVSILREDINIDPIDKDILDLDNEEYLAIYEDFCQYNKDVFRHKIWDTSLWEHSFQKTEFLPHIWDAELEGFQNGFGYLYHLKTNFVDNISDLEYTDIILTEYRMAERQIKEYIASNNIKTNISMELTKFNSNVSPKNIEYKIVAQDVTEINPSTIFLNALKKSIGEKTFYLEDLYKRSENITEIKRNELSVNTSYRLKFTPKQHYGNIQISKVNLNDSDIRTEYGDFILKDGYITNKKIYAHANNTLDLYSYDNINNVSNGMTVGDLADYGLIAIDVTGMSNQLINYNIECQEVDITDTSNIKPNGFNIDSTRTKYTSLSTNSLDNIQIDMDCNSYSFDFDGPISGYLQGSIIVTTTANGVANTKTYTSPTRIAESFSDTSRVSINIRKNGQSPVSISNVRMSSYTTELYLQSGNITDNGMYKLLPSYTGDNILYLRITPHTSLYPVLNYIHVGPTLNGVSYQLDFSTTGLTDPYIDIDSDCTVSLYEQKGSTYKLISNNYITKSQYRNSTSSNGVIILDTSDFKNVEMSDIEIRSRYNGGNNKYIIVNPNETVDKITIKGELSSNITTKRLSSIIYPYGNQYNMKAYISKNIDGIIVVDNNLNTTKLVKISKSDIANKADIYRITGLPNDVSIVYYLKNSKNITKDDYSDNFLYLSLIDSNSKEYIVYNDVNLITNTLNNVPLVNSFTPAVNTTQLLYYFIEDPLDKDTIITFSDNNQKWHFGYPQDGLNIDSIVNIDSSDKFYLEVSNVSSRYILSNEIPLEENYLINGQYSYLYEYLIDLDDKYSINYRDSKQAEELQLGNNRVLKTKFSNISNVSIRGIDPSEYLVLEDYGVILFDDNKHIGETLTVDYTGKVPYSIKFKDWRSLYNLIDYTISAYERVGQQTFTALKDGSETSVVQNSDNRYLISSSNDSFEGTIQNGKLKVSKLDSDNSIAVHNGYIYEDGLEYWYFSDRYTENLLKNKYTELHNVSRQGGELLFHIRSKNYLPNSNMRETVLTKLMEVDLTKRISDTVSTFNHFSACESLNLWNVLDMNVELTDNALNGYGLSFKSTANTGYAFVDITPQVIKDNIISLFVNGDLKVGLVKEHKVNNISFARNPSIFQDEVVFFKDHGTYKYYIIDFDKEPDTKYYLYIEGNNGTIDDILSSRYESMEEMVYSHTKNIDRFGFVINEKALPNIDYPLEFETVGAKYEDTYYDSVSNEICLTATVEYGYTKIDSTDLSNCYLTNAEYRKNNILAVSDEAEIRTRPINIRNRKSLNSICVKVNDLAAGKYKNFVIEAYGSSTKNGSYILLERSKNNVNYLVIRKEKINSYLYVIVKSEKGKEIHNIDTYVRYVEVKDRALPSEMKTSGKFYTKIYDIGSSGNYVLDGINYESTNNDVKFYIRGIRKNNTDYVFTEWYLFDPNATILTQPRFVDYRLFQFRVDISNSGTKVKIKNFNMQSVE